MFYHHINAQILISYRVVRGKVYVTSTPHPKFLAIYLVLGQSVPPLVSSTATTAHITKTFIKMLITEETQVLN